MISKQTIAPDDTAVRSRRLVPRQHLRLAELAAVTRLGRNRQVEALPPASLIG
jgi:hypothetical protein